MWISYCISSQNISCKNIDNDCLDISGAKVAGNFIEGSNIKDKGISFGENAKGEISNLNFKDTKLGVAVKDGSNLKLKNYEFKNNEFDAVVFNKKKEYEGAFLSIDNLTDENKLKYLIGFNNEIIKGVKNVGSIFVGKYSPEAIGDYIAGPNHVLPTSGSARFSSGLSVNDFLKRQSLIKITKTGIERLGSSVINLAKHENLDGHAYSVEMRLKKGN